MVFCLQSDDSPLHCTAGSSWFSLAYKRFLVPSLVQFSIDFNISEQTHTHTHTHTDYALDCIQNHSSIEMQPVNFLERFANKREDVKHRLNDIVDDLFAYLASELNQIVKPPDRVSIESVVRTFVDVERDVKQEIVDESTCEPIQADHNNNNGQPKEKKLVNDTGINGGNTDVATVGSNDVDTSQSPPTFEQSRSHTASTSSGSGLSGSAGTNVPLLTPSLITIHDEVLELDDDSDREHSDSDCDCEQCMGVPICKVDIDEEQDECERPSKMAKTNATNANDSIGDFHDDEGAEETCSATFKTISIKCSEDDCPSMFKNKIERNQHLLYVHGILPYTCLRNGCRQSFDNVRQYGEHVNTEHKKITSWPCTKCPKVCTDHRLLCRHIYFYHQEGRFKCRKSKCSFVAPFRIDVRKHSQLHTEMYGCQFGCGKSFSHTHHRKRHERIHLRLKPFRCKWPNCGYCSEARSTVIRHIRVRHFNLPLTLKQQNELNIIDNRNPRDYMEILTELMN